MEINITRNIYQFGITYLDIVANPIKCLDSYKISRIYFDENEEQELNEKLEIQFFKEIRSYADWQSIDKTSAQNYRLMADIDLNGKNDVNSNVSIGRLDGNGYAIKNITTSIEESGGIIKELKKEMYNITFESINITSNSSRNYLGIIGNNAGKINDVIFKNITINAPNRNFVACIAKNNAKYIDNISLEQINISGKNYVGSTIGNTNEQYITNINGKDIKIKGNGDYVGGIIGYIPWSDYSHFPYTKNINIENASISGKKHVGGIFGFGRIYYLQATDISVEGTNYVGGISGYAFTNNGWSNISNSEIKGIGNKIGGIAGYHDSVFYCNVNNCKIRGIGANSSYIGGIGGEADAISIFCSVNHSIIEGSGVNIGGINGNRAATKSFVYNTEVTGYSNVGGISGWTNNYAGNMVACYVNAKISAISNNVGGLVGYANNINANNKNTIKESAVYNSTIKGRSNVGGIIGELAEEPQDTTWFSRNYVEANIYGDGASTSLGIGSNKQYNSLLKDLYIYKYSIINNEFPNAKNEIFINENAYLVEKDLKERQTYTSKLKWSTSYWNFNSLNDNKYPILSVSSFPEQIGIDIPIDSEHILENAEIQREVVEEELENIFEYTNKKVETYSTYSVITAEDGSEVTRNTKLYVKENNLYAIPVVLGSTSENENLIPVANNLILDYYNGKQYETVLGSDGKMYDLKEPITYPDNFVNSDIESIGNNLNNDSHEVEVIYKDGDKIKFNYQTGEIISSTEENSNETSLFDYVKDKISELGNTNSGEAQQITTKYEESKLLQNKLEETPVEEALQIKNSNTNKMENTPIEQNNNMNKLDNVANGEDKKANNSLKETKYISIYNVEKDNYQIYQEEELLDTTKQEVISENDKIEANNLKEYYASEGKAKNTKMGIVWIALSIVGVLIILIGIWGRS